MNGPYTTTSQRPVVLIPLGLVRPHERHDPWLATELRLKIREEGHFTHPICLDRQTMALLDGHHRFRAAESLGLAYVPCVLVDYWTEDIEVTAWRSGEVVDRRDVLAAAASGNLMPIKTSRHLFHNPVGECGVPLSRLASVVTVTGLGRLGKQLMWCESAPARGGGIP
jgi:L-serine kinase (ADP)